MGISLIPLNLAGSAASAASGVVNKAVHNLVNSVIGVFDPGKARDAQRENRADMWYQIANMGSTYAGRHVYGGRTLVYTVKEKGYYEDAWNKLMSSNPRVAQQAQILGGLGIPDNPTQAEVDQMQQEVDAYNNAYSDTRPAGSPFSQTDINKITLGGSPTVSFTPSGTPLPGGAPNPQLSPAVAGNAYMLPTVVTTAARDKPVTHTWMYVLVGVLGVGLLAFLLHKRK